jgi:L-rhamnose mutarotase
VHYFAELNLLIAHMRYIGTDLEADAAGVRESEETRRWWKVSGVGWGARRTNDSGMSRK